MAAMGWPARDLRSVRAASASPSRAVSASKSSAWSGSTNSASTANIPASPSAAPTRPCNAKATDGGGWRIHHHRCRNGWGEPSGVGNLSSRWSSGRPIAPRVAATCYCDRMPTYRVWDDECETDADATEIAAACESDAAEEWAEQAECCGMFEDGRRISVKDEDGTVTRWTVIVE